MGLTQFSRLLVQVAAVLTTGILVVNVALHRPLIDAVLFSLAIAVGISPQLLPAVVATSLATGSRALARRRVLVKRLVGIEDLGNVDVLLTDKTGTLTDGRISFMRALGADGMPDAEPLVLGLVCTEATVADTVAGGNALDVALWQAPTATVLRPAAASWRRIADPAVRPRPAAGVGARRGRRTGRMLLTKGAPEAVFSRATSVPDALRQAAEREFAAGNRVVAVAVRPAPGENALDDRSERDLTVRGLLVFLDPPKPTARPALHRLSELGIATKIVTGDNPAVARRVCAEMGLPADVVVTGADVDAADDEQLAPWRPGRASSRVSRRSRRRGSSGRTGAAPWWPSSGTG